MNATLDLMKAHRSIRKFTDRDVDQETLNAIVGAAQCAATSHFVQAYTVIRVRDRSKRKAIAQLAGPQVWVETAPVFLVFCADLNRLESACRLHDAEMEKGWAEQFVTATVDTALLAQNVLLAAESEGLGGVFIGGIRNDPQTVCDLLDIPEQAWPVFGMCLGWPAHNPPRKPRLPVAAASAAPTTGPRPVTTLKRPLGRPASSARRAITSSGGYQCLGDPPPLGYSSNVNEKMRWRAYIQSIMSPSLGYSELDCIAR